MVHLIGFTTAIPSMQFLLSRYFAQRNAFPSQTTESALPRPLIPSYYLTFQPKHVRISLNIAPKPQAGRPVIAIRFLRQTEIFSSSAHPPRLRRSVNLIPDVYRGLFATE